MAEGSAEGPVDGLKQQNRGVVSLGYYCQQRLVLRERHEGHFVGMVHPDDFYSFKGAVIPDMQLRSVIPFC